MTQSQQDLDQWLIRVRQAKSRPEVLKLLDEFRPLTWTDEQRSVMGKAYVRVLDGLAPGPDETAAKNEKETPDGPVWYEKM